jgi:16S rRNA G527 N7-methylase RsmG
MATPYLKKSGLIIAMKGTKWTDELKEAKKEISEKQLALFKSQTYKLIQGEQRCLLIFKHN